MKGDFLGHAPEMYTALRNIAEVVVALNGDGIEIPLSLYVEVKRAEHLLAEIDKWCIPSERGTEGRGGQASRRA
jgi:hypothetical protein